MQRESFFVPILSAMSFHALAWILTGFLVISGGLTPVAPGDT